MTTENAEKDVFSFCKPVAKVCFRVSWLPCTEGQDAIPYAAVRIDFSHSAFSVLPQDDSIMFLSIQSCALTLLQDSSGSQSPRQSSSIWFIQILLW